MLNKELTQDFYRKLKKSAKYKPSSVDWFKVSYPVFAERKKLKDRTDLIELIAFAYSWMPTIPEVKGLTERKWLSISNYITRFDQLNHKELTKLLSLLIPVVNNSVVGTSKVLHFINPETMPIIDSRVVKTWNKTFGFNKELKLRSSLLYGGNEDKVINAYLKYRDHLLEWQKNCTGAVSLRDLEWVLYSQR